MNDRIVITEEYLKKGNPTLLEDAPLNYLYGEEVFFTPGFNDDKSILFQMVGNLGAYANDYDLDASINVFVISNILLEKMKTGSKDEILLLLENKLNSKGQPFKDLLIITESALINFINKRISCYNDTATVSTPFFLQSKSGHFFLIFCFQKLHWTQIA
jgi:hypothetical protein